VLPGVLGRDVFDHHIGGAAQYFANYRLVERTFALGIDRDVHTGRPGQLPQPAQIAATLGHGRLPRRANPRAVIGMTQDVRLFRVAEEELQSRTEGTRQHEGLSHQRADVPTAINHHQYGLGLLHATQRPGKYLFES
jgi:hypothetical protein